MTRPCADGDVHGNAVKLMPGMAMHAYSLHDPALFQRQRCWSAWICRRKSPATRARFDLLLGHPGPIVRNAVPARLVRLSNHQLLRVVLPAWGVGNGFSPRVSNDRAEPAALARPQCDVALGPGQLRCRLQPDGVAAQPGAEAISRQGPRDFRWGGYGTVATGR